MFFLELNLASDKRKVSIRIDRITSLVEGIGGKGCYVRVEGPDDAYHVDQVYTDVLDLFAEVHRLVENM